ncbi:MAG: cyclic nucleotide-binding/CBS domain-containing protein [Neisseriaceae bacterium]
MTIGNICKRETITIDENANLKEAAELMAKENIGFLVVTENNKLLKGTLADRDIVIKAIAQNERIDNIRVNDVMNKDLLILNGQDGVKDTLKALSNKGVRRAPIVDNNQIIGMVSIDDLVVMLVEELDFIAEIIQKQIA